MRKNGRAKPTFHKLEGPRNAAVTGPLLMMLRLVRDSVERGYVVELENLAKRYGGYTLIPAELLDLLTTVTKRGKNGQPAQIALRRKPARQEFARTTILRLIRLTRRMLRLEGYAELANLVSRHTRTPLILPLALANGVKSLLSKRIRVDQTDSRIGTTVIWSRCGGPIIGRGTCKSAEGDSIWATTPGQCNSQGGTWTPAPTPTPTPK